MAEADIPPTASVCYWCREVANDYTDDGDNDDDDDDDDDDGFGSRKKKRSPCELIDSVPRYLLNCMFDIPYIFSTITGDTGGITS